MKWDSKRFKAERERQGFTQEAFADAIRKFRGKATKGLVCQWEKGQEPGATYLQSICLILNKPSGYFCRHTKEDAHGQADRAGRNQQQPRRTRQHR